MNYLNPNLKKYHNIFNKSVMALKGGSYYFKSCSIEWKKMVIYFTIIGRSNRKLSEKSLQISHA